jgi:hypothetical protein
MINRRFYAFWAINDALDLNRLRQQLDDIRQFGFDGVVFHPRYYPNRPEYLGDAYMSILSETIMHAKSIGLEFWLYDENGWPSGTAGGKLLRDHPQDAQQWAEFVPEANGGTLHIHRGPGVDYLNPDLARHFLQITHERYRQGLSPAAFEHVAAFFCDEPEFGLGHAFDDLLQTGAIPWSPRLSEIYRQRHGDDLLPIAHLLFTPGDGYQQTRVRFWELLTDLFCESFIAPINQWCTARGKRFAAHVKGEEHPLFQVPMVGSCHQVFQHLSLPGIDALERYPSGHFFPRQVASAAQQFGDGQCMVECFGGAGWGASPEDLENYLAWLAGHGLTHFVFHLYQYRLTTHAIQDWPGSIPVHMTWRNVFPELLRRARALPAPPAADTLLIAPYRGIMREYDPRELLATNIHNGSNYPDTPAGRINTDFLHTLDRLHQGGIAYHVADERTIEQHGKLEHGRLRIGNCLYDSLVRPDSACLHDHALQLIAGMSEPKSTPIRVPDQEAEPLTAHQVHWKLLATPPNHLVLEVERRGRNRFSARFESAAELEIDFYFPDAVEHLTLNGKPVAGTSQCAKGVNEISFHCAAHEVIPFAAVRGQFAVRSRTPYLPGPNGALATLGSFFIDAPAAGDPADLIASGFPFCFDSITLQATLDLQSIRVIRLRDVKADCAHIFLGDQDCSFCWGPDWTIRLPAPVAARNIDMMLQLTPSTFNLYGPHHHIDGDRPIVSPGQYTYVKNFADRPDAPACTRVAAWHLKPFGIGSTIDVR